MLDRFLFPYRALLSNGAWSLQQNLEGAGRLSSAVQPNGLPGAALVSGWDPQASVFLLLGLLAIAAICLCPFTLLAGYVLGRRRGAGVVLLLLCLPGLLNFVGWWPVMAMGPEAFDIDGAGVTGEVGGMLPLVVLAVATGWTVMILAADTARIGKRFWDGYDHVWLVLGLLTVLFFVADGQVSQHDRARGETERDVQRASAYLARQSDAFDQWCRTGGQGDSQVGSPSCHWAADVHQKLLDQSIDGLELFAIFGPRSTADVYGRFGHPASAPEAAAIRTGIAAYN